MMRKGLFILFVLTIFAGQTVSSVKYPVYGSNILEADECAIYSDDTLSNLILIDTFHLKIEPPSSGIQFYRDGIVYLSKSRENRKMIPKHFEFFYKQL